MLEKGSGLKAGRDFHLAFSPEREDPGNPDSKVALIPKVVGGYTPACLEKAVALYSKAVKTVVPVSSCRAAEATKLLENTFRSVNIALVNELKMVYSAMGIDVWEVINAARTKPFGFMPFYPGPGLGGHCIPIDPFYLTWKAREFGQHTRFIELAGEINTSMPDVRGAPGGGRAERSAEGDQGQFRPGARAGLQAQCGRRARVAELRADGDAPGARGQGRAYYDPYVPVIKPTREHAHWAGTKSVAWNKKTITAFDAVLIATNHACVDYQQLASWAECIVDSRKRRWRGLARNRSRCGRHESPGRLFRFQEQAKIYAKPPNGRLFLCAEQARIQPLRERAAPVCHRIVTRLSPVRHMSVCILRSSWNS